MSSASIRGEKSNNIKIDPVINSINYIESVNYSLVVKENGQIVIEKSYADDIENKFTVSAEDNAKFEKYINCCLS